MAPLLETFRLIFDRVVREARESAAIIGVVAFVAIAGQGCDDRAVPDGADDPKPDRSAKRPPRETDASDDAVVKVGEVVVQLDHVTPKNARRLNKLAGEFARMSAEIAKIADELSSVDRKLGRLEEPVQEANAALDHAESRLARAVAKHVQAQSILEEDLKIDGPDSRWPFQSSPLRVSGNEVRQLALAIEDEQRLCYLAKKELDQLQARAATESSELLKQRSELQRKHAERKQSLTGLEAEARSLAGRNG